MVNFHLKGRAACALVADQRNDSFPECPALGLLDVEGIGKGQAGSPRAPQSATPLPGDGDGGSGDTHSASGI